jgi:predicted  nucleic acid-binding Zn-ribbon protein
MRTHLIILVILISAISSQTPSCTKGAFIFGDKDYLKGSYVCKGSTTVIPPATTAYESTLSDRSFWGDGLAWTFNSQQEGYVSPIMTGPDSIGLKWNKLNTNYIVQFQKGLPINYNSVVFVLRAGINYSVYRIDCINPNNPAGSFNVKGVSSKDELASMSVYLAQNPNCLTAAQATGCTATINSLNSQIDALTAENTALRNDLRTCQISLDTETSLSTSLTADKNQLEVANAELVASKSQLEATVAELNNTLNTCQADLIASSGDLQNTVQDLRNQLRTCQTNLQTNIDNVTSLQQIKTELEASLDLINTKFTQCDADLITKTTLANTLASDKTTLYRTMLYFKLQISSLKLHLMNLILNSQNVRLILKLAMILY